MREEYQRFARRIALPPSKATREESQNKQPNLRPVEQTLLIVINEPQFWHLVDEFRGSTNSSSAMEMALRRRGCTVRKRGSRFEDGVVQVWAKWEHPVPTEVASWLVDAASRSTRT